MQQMHASIETSCAPLLQPADFHADRGAVNRCEISLNLVENPQKGFLESEIDDAEIRDDGAIERQ